MQASEVSRGHDFGAGPYRLPSRLQCKRPHRNSGCLIILKAVRPALHQKLSGHARLVQTEVFGGGGGGENLGDIKF